MSILFNMSYTPQYMGGGYTLQTPVDNVLYSNKTTISTSANANAEALIFPNLETISAGAMKDRYKNNTSIKAVIMPKLIHVYGGVAENSNNGGLMNAFYGCTNLVEINFDSLETIEGSDAFQETFHKCTSLTSISFPNLKYITGFNGLVQCFEGCTSLSECSFPKLEEIYECRSFGKTFYGTALRSVTFPNLKIIQTTTSGTFSSYDVFGACFMNCSYLETVSFPSLESISTNAFQYTSADSGNNFGYGAFKNTPSLTSIHFPAAMQSAIEATTGYSTAWGHGDNSIVKFDL